MSYNSNLPQKLQRSKRRIVFNSTAKMGKEEQQKDPEMVEVEMQQLRSRATELLLREEWEEAVHAYSQFICLCQNQIAATRKLSLAGDRPKLQKSICLALSNRAEARSRLRNFDQALKDCEEALKVESTHFKTLLCKGKILLNLNRYSSALDCFKTALLDPQASGNSENLNGYVERCKKLEHLSKTGAFDLSDWVMNGFQGKFPELAEYIGPVQVQRSGISGRGLFATKNVDAGTLLLVTKAIAIERGILPEDCDENAQLVMWKNFIDKVTDSVVKFTITKKLIGLLSSGEDEEGLEVPDMSLFKPETEDQISYTNDKSEMGRILSILDLNSLVEDAVSAKVLGKNSDYYGVGLWILASFINHSCNPNARRLHIGDHIMVHASRDVKAGEEITFAYFDVLSPLGKRKKMSETWSFDCNCKRCRFEEEICNKEDVKEIEMGIERGMELGAAVYRLEEVMKRWMVRGKEKGYLRASFWATYSEVYSSEKTMKKWGRRVQVVETVVDSIADAVGSDERMVKTLAERFKRNGGILEMERILKLGRGVYGKVMKKQAMRSLLQLGGTHEHGY